MKTLFLIALSMSLFGCADNSGWLCKVEEKTMYSVNKDGLMGSAEKGCSCDDMREFEQQFFGSVDEQALQKDHGC
jgi:hypothetical protein